MTLELALITGFLFHLLGDYILQNDWMAQNKKKSFFPAFLHASIYSLPFLWLLGGFTPAWFVIYISHYFIDRFGLAEYWIRFYNWNWKNKNFGFDNEKPQFLSIWLLIIIDNSFHLLINSMSIAAQYLYNDLSQLLNIVL